MADYRGLVSDISPITQLLRTAGKERRETNLLEAARGGDQNAINRLLSVNPQLGGLAMKEQQAQLDKIQRERDLFEAKYASSLLGMDLGARFAKVQQDRESGLIDDELYTDITQFMGNTPDAAIQDQILINEIQANEPAFLPAQFAKGRSGFASAKTEIYPNGTAVQALPSGQVEVRDPSGRVVYGQERLDVLKAAQESKSSQAGERVKSEEQAKIDAELAAAEAKAEAEANKAKKVQFAKDAAAAVKASQATLGTLKNANRIYDRAISAIDKGAESGALARLMPTFRSETIELQNAIREAGLNTISGVTLGAISKPELELALAVDIPEGMDEKDLKPYLIKKKKANIKLMRELQKMATFLSKEGNTVAMWNEKFGGDTSFDGINFESESSAENLTDQDILDKY